MFRYRRPVNRYRTVELVMTLNHPNVQVLGTVNRMMLTLMLTRSMRSLWLWT